MKKEREIVLSVVIPAYNAEKTIVRALRSVKHNTLLSVEVLIVNDGSVDKTKSVCEGYIKDNTDTNVIIKLINQENTGHGSAINYGIKKARGKYLRILDADDYFGRNDFDRYLDFLSRVECDLVCSDYEEVYDGRRSRFYWHKGKKTFIDRRYDGVIEKTIPYLLPCAAVKTKILRDSGVVVDEKCYYDDQEYDFLIIQFCSTVSYFACPVYCYAVGDVNQSISKQSLVRNVKDHQKVVEWLIKRYYAVRLSAKKEKFIFEKMLVPLCYNQYYIAIRLKKSREDFLSFNGFLKKYKELYEHRGVAGKRLKAYRLLCDLAIWRKM